MDYLAVFSTEEGKRMIAILKNPDGIALKSRIHFDIIFDKGTSGRCIDGIDKVRGVIFQRLWNLSDAEWVRVTGLPVNHEDLIVEPL